MKTQALDLRGQCEARLGEWVAMDYPADGDELGEVAKINLNHHDVNDKIRTTFGQNPP